MARDAGGPGPSRRRRRSEPLDWLNADPPSSPPATPSADEPGEGSLFQSGQARAEGYRPGSGTAEPATGRLPSAPPMTRREARALETGRLPRATRRAAPETGRLAVPAPSPAPAPAPQADPFSRQAYEAAPETGPLPLVTSPEPPGSPLAPPSRAPEPAPRRPAPPSRPARPPVEPAPPLRDVAPTRSPKPGNPALTAGLTAAAAALLLWAAVPLLDSAAVPVHLLSTFCPLVTILAMPVLALSASRRLLVPGVVTAVAAVVPWLFAAGYAAAGPGPDEGSAAHTVRVMYVDGNHGRLDGDSITAAVREQAVDVLVMSGMSDALSHDVAVSGLNRLLTPRWVGITTGRTDGLGVWSRQGTVTMESVASTGSPTAQGLVTTPAGTFELVVTRISGSMLHPDPDWRDSLTKVAKLPARAPHRVLVGDLASTPWHPAFRALGADGWHDAADVNGRGLRPSWPAWSPVALTGVDHVLVSEGMGVSGVDSARVGGTPDRAVVASVVVPS